MDSGSSGSSQEVGMSPDADNNRPQTVLFFGKTGDGKSTLCNMLLHSDLEGELKTGADLGSVSEEVAVQSKGNWTVIDTVGLGEALQDSKTSTGNALRKLKISFATTPMDVDHICFVMRKGEFTKFERVYWEQFKEMFGTHKGHIRLIFTAASEKWLRDNENDIKELLDTTYPMISVDFPPKDDDGHKEGLLRTKREKNLKRLREFFEKYRRGEPVTIGREADSNSGSAASAARHHDSKLAKTVKGLAHDTVRALSGSGRKKH